MGRRRTRRSKKQLGGATNPSADAWGLHLYADILHDFGDIGADNFYNLNGANAKTPLGYTGPTDERPMMLYLFREETDANRKLFMGTHPPVEPDENILEFSVPERTAQTDKTVFTPIVDISSFGIVYDAGTFITTQLGARNVISFGNILDPASTTKDEDSKPIFVNKSEGQFQFPLSKFGFDPAKVGSICIKNVSKETVSVGINLNGANYDAVTLNPVGDICDASATKSIRDITIDKCGIFTSLTKAAAAKRDADTALKKAGQGAGAGDVITPAQRAALFNETWFKIGKTLGDTLLVASTMRDIDGNLNPFLAGDWVDWNSGAAIEGPPPSKFMLKTGDTLNHARAVLKNIPSILERPATKKYVKRYEFVPTDMSQVNYGEGKYEALKRNLISSIQTGYAGLIGELQSIDTEEKLLTNVDFEADDRKRSAGLLSRMRPALYEIAEDIGRLSARLSERLQERLELTSQNYKQALEFTRNVTPSASMFTKDYRTKTSTVKSSIHVTAPDTFAGISVPGLVIPYYNILTRARYGSTTPLGGEYRGFKSKVNTFLEDGAGAGAGAGAGQSGGVGEEDSMIVSPWEHSNAKAKLVGQNDTPVEIPDQAAFTDATGKTKETTQFPTIAQFQEYLGEIPVLSMVYGLKQHYDTAKETLIEDTIVLERILGELDRLELLGVHVKPAEVPENNHAILQFNLFVNSMYEELAGNDSDEIARLKKIRVALGNAEIPLLARAPAAVGPPMSDGSAATSDSEGDTSVHSGSFVYRTPPPGSPSAAPDTLLGTGSSGASVSPPHNDNLLSADRSSRSISGTASPVAAAAAAAAGQPSGMTAPLILEAPAPAAAAAPALSSISGREPKKPRIDLQPDAAGNVQLFRGGGLRRTYRKQKNARNSTPRVSRTSGLRKRKGTRGSRRV